MEHHDRHIRFWGFARFLLGGWSKRKFNITADPIVMPEGPNLILANHVSNYDPFFVAHGLGLQHTYFVCADNIMRKAWIRNFFSHWMAPIVQIKGKSGIKTVSEMMRRFKDGHNVAIFPEGNRTFDGRTTKQPVAVGKLAKKSGANLILLKMEGGYFTEPRFGTTLRKGRVHLSHTILTKEELAQMTAEEVTDRINEAIYTDAYEEQKRQPTKFRGKHLCLGMEAAIYQCPHCKCINTLRSDDNSLWCESEGCGFKVIHDEYGFLTDAEGKKHTLTEYYDAERAWMEKVVAEAKEAGKSRFLFEDTIPMKTVTSDYVITERGEITLRAYTDHVDYCLANTDGSATDKSPSDAFTVEGESHMTRVNKEDLEALAVFSRNMLTVFFPKNTTAYEIRGGLSFSALKYRDLYELN